MPHNNQHSEDRKEPTLLSPEWLKRLRDTIASDREKLDPYRNHRVEALKLYVGPHYGPKEGGPGTKQAVNLIELATNVYRRKLVGKQPRALVRTPHPRLKSQADTLELAIDHLLTEINFVQTMQDAALNGIFGISVVKVGISATEAVKFAGVWHEIGQPFADAIDEDDWVMDMTAKRWEQMAYMGHKYRLPFEFVMDTKVFENKKGLTATQESTYDEQGTVKAETISRGEGQTQEEPYREYIDLWDIYLPEENTFVTFPVENRGDRGSEKLMRSEKWQGPEGGPFHMLRFADVPGQIIGLPPRAMWSDLHELANTLWKKLSDQARDQKTVHGYEQADAEYADAFRKAANGQYLAKGPSQMQSISTPGPDPTNLLFTNQTMDQFDKFAGNLSAMGGLGTSSDTVGQDQMLLQQSSQRLQEMQDRMRLFTQRIVKDLAWYLWTDPLIDIPLVKRIEGTDIELNVRFTKEQREGDFLDYNFTIDPYSLQAATPASQIAAMDKVVGMAIQAMPVIQAQGGQLDIEAILKDYAKLTDLPGMARYVKFDNPVEEAQNQPVQPLRQAANTTRTNIRRSVPGGDQQGRDSATLQALAGGKAQGSQAASLAPSGTG